MEQDVPGEGDHSLLSQESALDSVVTSGPWTLLYCPLWAMSVLECGCGPDRP